MASIVIDAIRDEQLYVLTGYEFDDLIGERMENILQRRNPAPKSMAADLGHSPPWSAPSAIATS